jgi:7-cyano-7-deazaguanine synthase
VVLSGGMDSGVLLAEAVNRHTHRQVRALTFDYGAKHAARETASARFLARLYRVRHKVVRLPFIPRLFASDLLQNGNDVPEGHYCDPIMKRTVVPFRNGVMASIAVGYAASLGIPEVWIGSHAGDHPIYPDCRPEFIDAFNYAVHCGTEGQVRLLAPWQDLTKAQIAKIGAILSFPLELTWSCYRGGEWHCGRCATCVERKEALDLAGLPDHTRYLDPVYGAFPAPEAAGEQAA